PAPTLTGALLVPAPRQRRPDRGGRARPPPTGGHRAAARPRRARDISRPLPERGRRRVHAAARPPDGPVPRRGAGPGRRAPAGGAARAPRRRLRPGPLGAVVRARPPRARPRPAGGHEARPRALRAQPGAADLLAP